ncbi:MAG TPA: sigma-54 dependent transcriptional regulator [Pirellulales bacterium]|jgi:NtrC-family two-component system response regulator AlgB|nr:sigma-54 dependent transcriptional regulator [Pirellulales bacterium]
MLRVLIIDDEKNIRSTLTVCLESMGCEVRSAGSPDEALATVAQRPFDLVFLDLRLRETSGLDLLPKLLAESPGLGIVVLTAYATIETAVEALKRGAIDYLPKPFTPEQIRHLVNQFTQRRQAEWRLAEFDQQLKQTVPEIDLDTHSPKMRAALEVIVRAAQTDSTVLLRGENGTGKGVLARTLHLHSRRQQYPFVMVNCPTLSEELLASEMFGHVRGSFTGAVRDQPGRVEAAEGGTLFLDEVGEISPALQAKLLRFLQEKQFERIGETRTRVADVRVVAATNRDLETDVRDGRFREDLLYRLNVVEVVVPSLRDRPEDILPLARQFLAFFARSIGRPIPNLAPATEQILRVYHWPGNVRQLRNAMERAVILWPTATIEPEALPEQMLSPEASAPTLGGDFTLEELERRHILAVLARKATVEEAAHTLGIDTSTLWRKRKRYDAS